MEMNKFFAKILETLRGDAQKGRPNTARDLMLTWAPNPNYVAPERKPKRRFVRETIPVGRNALPTEESGAYALCKDHKPRFRRDGKEVDRKVNAVPMMRIVRIDRSKDYRGQMGAKDIARRNHAIGGYHA